MHAFLQYSFAHIATGPVKGNTLYDHLEVMKYEIEIRLPELQALSRADTSKADANEADTAKQACTESPAVYDFCPVLPKVREQAERQLAGGWCTPGWK